MLGSPPPVPSPTPSHSPLADLDWWIAWLIDCTPPPPPSPSNIMQFRIQNYPLRPDPDNQPHFKYYSMRIRIPEDFSLIFKLSLLFKRIRALLSPDPPDCFTTTCLRVRIPDPPPLFINACLLKYGTDRDCTATARNNYAMQTLFAIFICTLDLISTSHCIFATRH